MKEGGEGLRLVTQLWCFWLQMFTWTGHQKVHFEILCQWRLLYQWDFLSSGSNFLPGPLPHSIVTACLLYLVFLNTDLMMSQHCLNLTLFYRIKSNLLSRVCRTFPGCSDTLRISAFLQLPPPCSWAFWGVARSTASCHLNILPSISKLLHIVGPSTSNALPLSSLVTVVFWEQTQMSALQSPSLISLSLAKYLFPSSVVSDLTVLHFNLWAARCLSPTRLGASWGQMSRIIHLSVPLQGHMPLLFPTCDSACHRGAFKK